MIIPSGTIGIGFIEFEEEAASLTVSFFYNLIALDGYEHLGITDKRSYIPAKYFIFWNEICDSATLNKGYYQ